MRDPGRAAREVRLDPRVDPGLVRGATGRPGGLVEHHVAGGGQGFHSHQGRHRRTAARAGRLSGVRIARFTTGDEPQYGVITGDVDDLGIPAEDAAIVALAGDPLYVGVQLTDTELDLADVAAARAGHPAEQGGRDRQELRRPCRRDGR